MEMREDFDKIVERLKRERDQLKLRMHLASMEVKEEFGEAEKKWQKIKTKAAEIADDAVETSDDYVDKAKIIGEELKETYNRITKRLSQ